MKRRSILLVLLIGSMVISLNLIMAVHGRTQEKIQIGTAPQGGTYYAIGAGIAQILNKWGGFKATAQATGGGTQNCRLIDSGEINMATMSAQQLIWASKGEKPFTKKIDLRVGFYMYEDPFEVVVLDESPIRSIYDLKGRKVAVGAMGSGVEGKSKDILGIYGLRYEDFKPRFIGMGEATDALKDGMVDAAVLFGALPTPAIVEISLLRKIRILPIGDEIIDKLLKELPYLVPLTIPANTYKNQPNEVKIVAENSFIVFSPKMAEDVAYRIVKLTFEHLDYLVTVHKAAEKFNLKKASALDFGVPYHSGAIKFFKESGVWKR
jgi:TRAP transporter TAXI family solute receptor